MKIYENPMLQVVSISKNDIIATSTGTLSVVGSETKATSEADAPGMRSFDDWDAGY